MVLFTTAMLGYSKGIGGDVEQSAKALVKNKQMYKSFKTGHALYTNKSESSCGAYD